MRTNYYGAEPVFYWLRDRSHHIRTCITYDQDDRQLALPRFEIDVPSRLAKIISKELGITLEDVMNQLRILFVRGFIIIRRTYETTQLKLNGRHVLPHTEELRDIDQMVALIPLDNQWHGYSDIDNTELSRFDTLCNLIYSANHMQNECIKINQRTYTSESYRGMTGKIWITNGEVNRQLLKDQPIPDGFHRGITNRL